MKSGTYRIGDLSTKLIAYIGITLCIVIGAVGLIVPVMPGLVFLAIAAMIASRHFPSMARWLRPSRPVGMTLDNAERFAQLTFRTKLWLGGLLGLKMLLDGIAFVLSLVPWPRRPATGKLQR